jgi:hypothetical protein
MSEYKYTLNALLRKTHIKWTRDEDIFIRPSYISAFQNFLISEFIEYISTTFNTRGLFQTLLAKIVDLLQRLKWITYFT